MKYSQNSKKGLSPLVGAVLLIVFTIGIGAIIMSWVNTYTKETTYDASRGSKEVLDCASTNIKIEDIYINSANSVKLILRNTGLKPIQIKEAIVWDVNGTKCLLNFSSSLLDVSAMAELTNNSCPITFTPGCNEFKTATVTTTCSVTSRFEDVSKLTCNII